MRYFSQRSFGNAIQNTINDAAFLRRHFVERLESRTLLASIASGQTLTGTIASAGASYSYTFSASAGDMFEVSLSDVSTASSGNKFSPYIQVVDPNMNLVISQTTIPYAGETDTSAYSTYKVPATAVGVYNIVVKDDISTETGGLYALEMIKTPGGIAPDSDNDGGVISSGQTKFGTINRYGDMDAYTFSANVGDLFEVSLSDVSTASSGNVYSPYIQVIDPNGSRVINQTTTPYAGETGTSAFSTYSVPATAVGTYTIIVKDNNNYDRAGLYALEMIKTPGGIAPDSDNDGGVISSGQTKFGTINRYGDMDAYTFSANVGDLFEVSLGDVSPSTSGNKFAPSLQVIDRNGSRVIDTSSGYASTSVFASYTVPAIAAGTYTIIVADDNNYEQAGLYALELIKVPGTLAAGSDGDGGVINNGQTKTGTINRLGELDAYSFFAAAGDSVSLSSVINGSNFNAQITVYTPSGSVLKSGSSTSALTLSATNLAASGIYTVVVRNSNSSGQGAYTLTFTDTAGTHNPAWLAPDSGAGYSLANNTLAVSSGAVTLVADASSTNFGLTVVVSGAAKLYISSTEHLGSLTLSNTATVLVVNNGKYVESVTGLSIAGGASLDLTNNTLIDDYSGSTPAGAIRSALISGQIFSSAIAATPNTTLGYAEASAIVGPSGGTFAGQTVDSTALLVRFTYAGDVNLNRTVDISDLSILASNFGGSSKVFSQGDFNYDGLVDISDLTLLANNFGKTLTF